jgi:hypothetical protein
VINYACSIEWEEQLSHDDHSDKRSELSPATQRVKALDLLLVERGHVDQAVRDAIIFFAGLIRSLVALPRWLHRVKHGGFIAHRPSNRREFPPADRPANDPHQDSR